MLRRLLALGAALALSLAIVAPVSAASGPCVTLYENINGGGASWTSCGLNWTSLGAWNDRASSLLVTGNPSTSRIRFYPDTGFKDNGTNQFRVITVTGNDYLPDLRKFWPSGFEHGMSDVISSFKRL